MSVVEARSLQSNRNPIHRKPLPVVPGAGPAAVQSQSAVHPDQNYLQQPQQRPPPEQQRQPPPPQQSSNHSRSRTSSSNVLPLMPGGSQSSPQPMYPNAASSMGPQPGQATRQYGAQGDRNSMLSNAASTMSSQINNNRIVSSGNAPMRQNSTTTSSSLQRSTSSRSGTSSNSYVAMMRKQKATVWSDRAQYEDPRLKNQQKLAKLHARAEISGTSAAGRISSGSSSITGGVRSKIRHHGAPKATQYAANTLSAAGVPIRLSQNEIDEDDSDDGSQPGMMIHRRTDSGRSSLGSTGRSTSMTPPGQAIPTGQAPKDPSITQGGLGSAEETPVPDHFRGSDYFSGEGQQQPPVGLVRAGSGGSGSTDRENSFGTPGELPQRVRANEEETLDAAELRRRGSVDERTMTMSGYGKLFVANPDVDD